MPQTKPQTLKEKLKTEFFIPSKEHQILVTFAGDIYDEAYRDGKLNNGDKVDPDKVREVDVKRPVDNLPSVVGDIETI